MAESRMDPTSPAPLHAHDEYDALADLFLSHEAARYALHKHAAQQASQAPSTPTAIPQGLRLAADDDIPLPAPRGDALAYVEALILGHLPVAGSSWVLPYARSVADDVREVVALLRLQEGYVTLDLVPPRGATSREHLARMTPDGPTGGTLARALEHARSFARHWIVRVDELAEHDLAHLDTLDAITILSGADDAAVVASYRTCKAISPMLEKARGGEQPRLGVAIMGADADKARIARQRLEMAARVGGREPFDVLAQVGKVGGVPTAPVYRGDASMDLEAIIAALDARATTDDAWSDAHDVHPSHPVFDSPNALDTPGASPARSTLGPRPQPVVTHAPATRSHPQPVAASPHASAHASPHAPAHAGHAPGTRDIASIAAPRLGVRVLDVRCPYVPDVAIAADATGGVHLLGTHDGGAGALEMLLRCAAWTSAHAWLLEAAGGPPAARWSSPTLHVLAKRAEGVRGLLESPARVHVLLGDEVMSLS